MDLLDRVTLLAKNERAALAALARAEGAAPEDAVECVQDGLCTLLTRAQQSKLPPDPDDWGAALAVIVRNLARNGRRRHHRARPHEALDEHALSAEVPDADALIERAEDHIRLQACVADLCETQRAVVALRLLQEQPGEDVARALGITPGHVAVLLHRAKAALRVCMTS